MTKSINKDVVEIPMTLAVELAGVLTGPDYLLRELKAIMGLPPQVQGSNPLRDYLALVKEAKNRA